MNAGGAPSAERAAWLPANEARIVATFALALLAANLLTSLAYPTSWMDEAMFSDPGIHAATGQGLVSTAWWQSKELTWSGNVPLYSVALIPWFKAVGVSLVRTRAFNYGVICLVIPIFWLGIKRLGLVASAGARIALIATAFLSYTLCVNYRSARPDCLGILICAVALLAWSWENRLGRCAVLFMAGFLAPTSGLQLAAYLGYLCGLVFLLQGKRALWPLGFVAAGVAVGAGALYAYYHANHLTGVLVTIEEGKKRLHFADVGGSAVEPAKLHLMLVKAARVFTGQLKETGIMPVLLVLGALLFDRAVRSDRKLRFVALAGLLGSSAFVAFLVFFMHFLDYYHWMTYMILVVAVFAIIGRAWGRLNRFTKTAVVILLAGAMLAGMPLRVFLGFAMGQPAEFDRCQEAVRQNVKSSDVVFTDFMGYFPARARAAEVFLPPYGQVMTRQERASVNVLILDPVNFAGYTKEFSQDGQRWKEVAAVAAEPGRLARLCLRLLPNYRTKPQNCGYVVTILRRLPDAEPGN